MSRDPALLERDYALGREAIDRFAQVRGAAPDQRTSATRATA
jgi:hypothetical protein